MSTVVKVLLTVSTSVMTVPEKRYALSQTILSIKENAYTHFAIPADRARLELYDDRGVQVERDLQDKRPLGYYQCKDDYRIHVVDVQPPAQQENYTDVSQVEKFEISEEEWLKRGDNMRAFKQRMLEQQRAAMVAAGVEPPKEVDEDDSYQEAAAAIHVGDRCLCAPGDRLGTVRYVGRLSVLKPGFWVGVEFDEPVGKSDGSVKGVRVFECLPKYGGFVRPDAVTVGDYPPEVF